MGKGIENDFNRMGLNVNVHGFKKRQSPMIVIFPQFFPPSMGRN